MSAAEAGRELFRDAALEQIARTVLDESSTESERLRAARRLAARIVDRQSARREAVAAGVRRHKLATAVAGVAMGTALYVAISRRARRRAIAEERERERLRPPPWMTWSPSMGSAPWEGR